MLEGVHICLFYIGIVRLIHCSLSSLFHNWISFIFVFIKIIYTSVAPFFCRKYNVIYTVIYFSVILFLVCWINVLYFKPLVSFIANEPRLVEDQPKYIWISFGGKTYIYSYQQDFCIYLPMKRAANWIQNGRFWKDYLQLAYKSFYVICTAYKRKVN